MPKAGCAEAPAKRDASCPVFIRIGFERLEVAKHPILKGANRMNSHKRARLTYARRLEMVRQMLQWGWSACEAASARGVTPATAASGDAGPADASSRPAKSPRHRAGQGTADRRAAPQTHDSGRIAASVDVSDSTVSRVLARVGLSKLSELDPAEPVVRYEHDSPGDLLHIDTKKLGRIERP